MHADERDTLLSGEKATRPSELRCSAWSTRLPERSGGDGAAGDSRVTPVCDQWTEEKRVRKVGVEVI